jgi:hypothetical protein
MPHSDTYNLIYLLGIILSFFVGFSGLWIGIRNSRKTIFINSITASRIKYIQDLRNSVSEFCGLVYSYNTEFRRYGNEKDGDKRKLLDDLYKRVDNLKYLIRLHLNIEDEYFDLKIIELIDKIIELSDKEPSGKIDELIIIMQYLLKLEWEGAKLESARGIVSRRRKRLLYSRYKQKHEAYIESKKLKIINSNEQE